MRVAKTKALISNCKADLRLLFSYMQNVGFLMMLLISYVHVPYV